MPITKVEPVGGYGEDAMSSGGARSLRPSQPGRHRGIASATGGGLSCWPITSATIQSAYFTLPPTTGKMYLYARFAGGTDTNNYSFKLTVVSFPPTSGIDCSAQPSCGR